MTENVGGIFYTVSLDTAQMVRGQRDVDQALKKTTGSLDAFDAKLSQITSAIKIYSAVMATIKAAQMADDMRLLSARVEVAAGSFDAGSAAMTRLVDISRRTQTAVEGNVQVFTRLNASILAMGGTQNDTLRITELLSKAIRVSGASAVEGKSAMIQFGQALGSGKLAGDELRSLLENAPYLMKQLAAGLGVPIGALKQMGEQGKLTADVVTNALGKAAAQIEADFAKFPQTLSGAMDVAADAAKRANEKLDELTGKSAALTGVTKGLGEVLDKLADQFGAANTEAGRLGRNTAIQGWANSTKVALSYVVDAADMVWQSVSVLGRNVAFVFTGIGNEIGGIGAQVNAVLHGDFSGARAIGEAMRADSETRRKELDAADAKTLEKRKLFGQQMRDAWAAGAGGGRGSINPEPAASKLKSTTTDDKAAKEAQKLAARALAAREYYEGLVAGNKTALEKIDAEEAKALTENEKRRVADGKNAQIYAMAKIEIQKKFARERAQLEEKTTQEVADLNIQLTTDEVARIEAVRAEEFRRADAAVKLGTKTFAEGERAKTLAAFTAQQQRNAIGERLTQANADNAIAATTDELTKIDLMRQEALRKADAAVLHGQMTFAEGEAAKARAAIDAQNSIRQQVLSINPLAALEKEYQDKLAIVKLYEQQMAQAGVDGTQFLEEKRTELSRAYQQQRLALAEAEFVAQSDGNKFLMDSLNSLASTATSSITGLINGTMSAADAVRGLANVVLSEAVGALVQIGLQYIKNAVISQAADKAMLATKAANAALFTAAVSAQVAVTSSLAAASAFAATAAIPIIGPALAPAAAAAAATMAAGLGAPAIAAAPIAGARRYGGPVSADSLYQVNETGAPEMFTAGNKQYMMPTRSGQVTPADRVGGTGAVAMSVEIHNYANAQVSTQMTDDKRLQVFINEAASQIRERSGPMWSALRTTNVQGRL